MRVSGGYSFIAAALCFLVGGCQAPEREPSLDEVRAVAEKYRDVNVAKAEGYTTDNKCVTAAMLGHPAAMGAMGLHYVRRDLLGLLRLEVGAQDIGKQVVIAVPAALVVQRHDEEVAAFEGLQPELAALR